MKKRLLIMGLIISSLIFAKEFNDKNDDTFLGNKMPKMEVPNDGMNKLTDAQQKDLENLMAKHKKEMETYIIAQQEKDLAIKKEMIADNINWNKVENITKQQSIFKGQMELLMLQEEQEIKSKLGIDIHHNIIDNLKFENKEFEKPKM